MNRIWYTLFRKRQWTHPRAMTTFLQKVIKDLKIQKIYYYD